jgi:hypothetical protein
MKRVLACVFHPPSGTSDAERLVDAGRAAAARDLISKLREAGVKTALVAPPSRDEPPRFDDLGIDFVEASTDGTFHFGESLKRLIRERRPDGLLYFGSGSGLLLSHDRIEQLRRFACRETPAALLNNFYSCDYAAVSEAVQLLDVKLPRTDNPLGLTLADAGLLCFALERNAETQFDIDTPTDLLVLRTAERGGPAIRSLLDRLDLPHPFLPRLLELFCDRTALVHFIGRVSPRTWSDVEREIACRTGGSIEGRGMRTGASVHPPFLQQTLREEGERVFFRRLSEACDGAVIDTRPLLAEASRLPEADVRFASDLLRPEAIRDPRWRSFTEAALGARIPILLGGHSIVSGGLYLLAEACWKGRDLGRRLHPEPFDPDKERS